MNTSAPEVFGPLEPLYNVRFHGTHYTAANCPRCGMRNPQNGDRLILYLAGLGVNKKTKAVCRKCSFIWWPENDVPEKTATVVVPEYDKNVVKKERRIMWNEWRKLGWGFGYWEKRGISGPIARALGFKYRTKRFWSRIDGEMASFELETLVIPFFSEKGRMLNLQYRLLDIPSGFQGKYRWHSKEVPFVPWRSRTGAPPDTVYLVEGAIKGAGLHQQLQKEGKKNVLVMASSQHRINSNELPLLPQVERYIYIPDPDVWETKGRLAENLKDIYSIGVKKIVLVRLETKVDDLILEVGNKWRHHTREIDPQGLLK